MAAQMNDEFNSEEEIAENHAVWKMIFDLISLKWEKPDVFPPLFQIEKNGKSAYVMGSINILQFPVIPSVIKDLLKKCKTLVTEATISPQLSIAIPQEMLEICLRQIYPDFFIEDGEDNGFRRLSLEQRKVVIEYIKAHMLKNFKVKFEIDFLKIDPYTALQIVIEFLQNQGMETQLLETFDRTSKKVLNFGERIALFQSGSDEEESEDKYSEVDFLKIKFEDLKLCVRCFESETILKDTASLNILQNAHELVKEHRKKMFSMLLKYHSAQIDAFYIMGASNLIGKDGLLNFLKAEGFTLSQNF